MWSDNETVEDLIGFRVHAELIASVVTDQKLLPITMGVFGDWGNGKTSIMKMLQAELSSHDDIAVLYFDAWLFEGYDDAKSALISSIVRQMSEHKRFPAALKDQAKNLIQKVNWMRVLKMGWDNVALPAVLAYATGGATAVPGLIGGLKGLFSGQKPVDGDVNLAGALNSENVSGLISGGGESEIAAVRDFRDEFADLLAKTSFKSLVVLIDDLDRCSPERIVENLEAIKLFLNVGSTAFIIGADPRIVKHAIAVRYRDSLDAARAASSAGENANEAGEQLVRDYVEKLIQLPYHLPRLSPAEIETYLCLLFSQRDLTTEGFTACLTACDSRRAANRFGTFGLADIQEALGAVPVPETLRTALTFTAGAAPLITENLKGNPRQVKRFLNAFVLRKKLASVARIANLRDDVLLKLMLLEYSNEVRFRELARWHEEQNATPRELQEIENGASPPKEWDKPSLERWAKMEPLLADVDLSEYFWLARDKLASSLAGMSLVAPVV
ncbi:MAG TPA: P-loop NTPase fold protein, partial [Prosthecobacter sp.]